MHKDLQKAKEQLVQNSFTCVLCKDDILYTSCERGVAPLLNLYDAKTDVKDFCAADKVVGKGAAHLYILFKIKALYAEIISEGAKELLEQNGIEVYYKEQTSRILNRTKTGFCPIETAVLDTENPTDALLKIRNTLKELRK